MIIKLLNCCRILRPGNRPRRGRFAIEEMGMAVDRCRNSQQGCGGSPFKKGRSGNPTMLPAPPAGGSTNRVAQACELMFAKSGETATYFRISSFWRDVALIGRGIGSQYRNGSAANL